MASRSKRGFLQTNIQLGYVILALITVAVIVIFLINKSTNPFSKASNGVGKGNNAGGGGSEVIDTEPPVLDNSSYLSVRVHFSDKIGVSWLGATDNVGVAGYKLYRDGVVVGTTDAPDYKYIIDSVKPETNYTYHVTAVDTSGNESTPTVDKTVTTPAADALYGFGGHFVNYTTGQPAVGAVASLYSNPNRKNKIGGNADPVATATLGEDGKFRFDVTEGYYTLKVTDKRCKTYEQVWTIGPLIPSTLIYRANTYLHCN